MIIPNKEIWLSFDIENIQLKKRERNKVKFDIKNFEKIIGYKT